MTADSNCSTSNTNRIFGKDLLLRVASASIIAPVALFCVWMGGLPFFALISLGAFLMLHEWLNIVRTDRKILQDTVLILLAVACCMLVGFEMYLAAVFCFLAGTLLVLISPVYAPQRVWVLLGLTYVALSVSSLVSLRNGQNGQQFIFWLFILVWANDIGGYFFGRLLGGPKLWRRVSPKKTWSGALGGLILGLTCAVATAGLAGYEQIAGIALFAIVLSCISQLGDLAESALKRKFNVKDSGSSIPGHGGILDRVDGLATASVAAFVIGALISSGFDATMAFG